MHWCVYVCEHKCMHTNRGMHRQIYGGQMLTMGISLDCSVLYIWRESLVGTRTSPKQLDFSVSFRDPLISAFQMMILPVNLHIYLAFMCVWGIITLVLVLEHQVLHLLGYTLSPFLCLLTLLLCLSNSRLVLSNGERHLCTY